MTGARWFFDQLERIAVETSNVSRELTDDEIELLSLDLERVRLLPAFEQTAIRRMLAHIADVIAERAPA